MQTMIFHGGGGPATVAGLAAQLGATAPILPGWEGTPRGPELTSVAALADHYARTLPADTVVIGSSIGGWLAAEIALRTRVKGLVMINNAGALVTGHPIASLKGLPPPEIAKLSFHDPAKFRMPPPERLPVMIANQATLYAIAGEAMSDPTLLRRLGEIRVPALVVWGESDRVVSVDYGRAVAAAIPGARFELVREAGHLPHVEQPEATHRLIADFIAAL